MKLKTRLSALLFVISALFSTAASAAPTILSLSYTSTDVNLHIGSVMTVSMCVADTNSSFQLTGQNAVAGSVDLAGSALSSVTTSTIVYITDGIHVWHVFYGGGATITISDGALAVGSPIGNYSNFNAQAFNCYGNGAASDTFIASGSAYASIAGTDTAPLAFSGNIWQGTYVVPNRSSPNPASPGGVTSGYLYGYFTSSANVPAANNGYQGPQQLQMDETLPGFLPGSVGYSIIGTTNYVNPALMYISSNSNLNSPKGDVSNSRMKVLFALNKTNCTVYMTVNSLAGNSINHGYSTPAMVPATLPTVFLGTTVTAGYQYWYGTDGNGNYVPDGAYQVTLTPVDSFGNTGLTTQVDFLVTSLQMKLENISISPQAATVRQGETVWITVGYDSTLQNASGTSILNALQNLGWSPQNGVPAINAAGNSRSQLFSVFNLNLYGSDGSVDSIPKNLGYTADEDAYLLLQQALNVGDQSFPVAEGYNGTDPVSGITLQAPCNGTGGPNVLTSTGLVDISANNPADDWENTFGPGRFKVVSGTTANPLKMSVSFSTFQTFVLKSAGALTVAVDLRSTLTGMDWEFLAGPPTSPNMPDPCQAGIPGGSATPVFESQPIHFFPSAFPEGATDYRGNGLTVIDDTHFIYINTQPAPVPSCGGSSNVAIGPINPTNGSVIQPNIYRASNPLTAVIQSGCPIDPESCSITLSLGTGAQSQSIPGSVGISLSNNGNQGTLSFSPNVPLTASGTYTMVISAGTTSGTLNSSTITFSIADTAPPNVTNVQILPSIGGTPVSVYPQSGAIPSVSGGITQVLVTLGMPYTSSNTIDWNACTIQLVPMVNGVPGSAIPMTCKTCPGAPSNNTLIYQLNTPLFTSGSFEVIPFTVSQNSQGQTFNGPAAGFQNPQFNVVSNNNLVNIFQPDYHLNPAGSNLSLQMTAPVTITSSNLGQIPAANLTAGFPSSMAAPPTGWTPLPVFNNGSSTPYFDALQFFYGTTPIKGLTPQSASPMNMNIYFYGTDTSAVGITPTGVALYGYQNGAWTQESSAVLGPINPAAINFTLSLVSGQALPDYLAVMYQTSSSTTPVQTPTAISFNSSRAFNPTSSNPLHNQAKIYYTTAQPQDIQVKIYNVAGALIKTLSKTNGINISAYDMDPGTGNREYYFTWNGMNDSNALVKNGVYVIWFKVTDANGNVSTNTQTIALIK